MFIQLSLFKEQIMVISLILDLSSASLRKLDEQPEWLKGGKLRDYQLEGLNFLVNRLGFQDLS